MFILIEWNFDPREGGWSYHPLAYCCVYFCSHAFSTSAFRRPLARLAQAVVRVVAFGGWVCKQSPTVTTIETAKFVGIGQRQAISLARAERNKSLEVCGVSHTKTKCVSTH